MVDRLLAGHSDMIVLRTSGALPAIALHPMTAAAAVTLGQAFEAIAPWARYPFSARALSTYLALLEPDAPRYLITSGGDVAGAIGVRNAWLRGPYLQFLGIVPAYQRQGIGQLALCWLEDSARAAGERNLWVAASDFNEAALSFYEGQGFTRAASLDDLVQDGICEILLRKRLAHKN